jgi:hypothetical protein
MAQMPDMQTLMHNAKCNITIAQDNYCNDRYKTERKSKIKSVQVKSCILKCHPLVSQCCNGHMGYDVWRQVCTVVFPKNSPGQ